MKKGILIFVCLVSLWSCQNPVAENPMERQLVKQQALKDFNAFSAILKTAHPSLNIYISPKKFNLLLDSISNTITGETTVGALFSKYNFITNEIGCAHTYMNIAGKDYDSLLNRKFFFPFPVKLVDGALLVNAKNMLLPEGTTILAIDEKPVDKILQDIMIYETVEGLHRATQQKLAAEFFALNYFYAYGPSQNFSLQVIDTAGQEKTLNNIAPTTLDNWFQNKNNNIYYFDRTICDYDLSINEEKKYALMRIETFSYDTEEEQAAFENFLKNAFELLQLKKNIPSLIIDIRENLGGDLYNSSLLFSYLAREPFREYQSASCRIGHVSNQEYLSDDFLTNDKHVVDKKLSEEFVYNSSNRFYMRPDSLIDKWEPQPFAFKGRLYVITNARVASAASYFSVMVKNSGVGKIIGEETVGGSFSGNAFNSLRYSLPYSKLQLAFPFGHIVYTYKEKKNLGRGLMPNFDVPDSYLSFKKNQDRQLMFIRDSLLSKN